MKDFTKKIITLLDKKAKKENCKIKQKVRDDLIRLLDETEGIKEDVIYELCNFKSTRGADDNVSTVHMYLRNVSLVNKYKAEDECATRNNPAKI